MVNYIKRKRKPDIDELVKLFLFLFTLSFIIFNWNNVSWIFNYREVEGLVSDFFNPYPDTALALVNANSNIISQTPNLITSNLPEISLLYPYSDKDNSLEIPKIGVDTAVVVATSTDKVALAKNLDQGATYYPGSVLPGEDGQMVILGHSAPPNWPHIKHDYIFSDLQNLVNGDQIILTFDHRQFTYKVIAKQVIQRGGDVPEVASVSNILTLISCWPPGKDYQRITVTAELIKN